MSCVFSPLQVSSSYSLLQSSLKIDDYVTTAKNMGYKVLALTDYNVMYGMLTFYHACKSNGIKPLLGLTLQLKNEKTGVIGNELILIAQGLTGYHNLMKISSLKLAKPEGVALNLEDISEYFLDLTVIIPAVDGEMNSDALKMIVNRLEILQNIVKSEDLYMGVSSTMDLVTRRSLVTLADKQGISIVAAQPVQYVHQTDYFGQQVLQAIKNNTILEKSEINPKILGANYLKSISEIKKEYMDCGLERAFDTVSQVCAKSNLELDFPKTKLPHYKTPKKMSSQQYLRDLCLKGLTKRINEEKILNTQPYQQRLEHELSVISDMGFNDYFLIVADITRFAQQQQIMLDPGRGSAAGSLVAYVLEITDVDPLQYNLLFERFLNSKRAQMPDIDIDLPDNKRDEVIHHIYTTYGESHMAQIITFDTLGAKQAIRDVGRVLGFKTYELDEWSKAIPNTMKIGLKNAYEKSQTLRNLVADNYINKLLYETALQLEGLPRHYSKHAAGIILSDHDLRETVPVRMGNDNIWLTQYAKGQVEEVGLLKIDLLGLRNLSLLSNAVYLVKKGYGITNFDVHKIDLNDASTLALFQKGDTVGVFQFESGGIRSVLRKVKPTSFEDVVAVNALYRPGPMDNIDEFVARKQQQHKITYPDKALEPILRITYGIIVYQEQVMQVASIMGGFSLGEADLLRRAMSGKKQIIIEEMKSKFLQGAQKKGFTQQIANQVYTYIERFADYGFNRSHAIAYSKLAFQLAFIKAHYPAAFYAALLNTVIGSQKTRDYVFEAKKYNVDIKGPDINQSEQGYVLKQKAIYFGLSCIKKLRRDFISNLIQERRQNGKYKNFSDFLKRIDPKFRKDEYIDALIYSGALDGFDTNRNRLISLKDAELKTLELTDDLSSQLLMTPAEREVKEQSLNERLEKEIEYLGMALSGHPIEKYTSIAKTYRTKYISELEVGMKTNILVYIKNIRVITTKKGDDMAFITGSDQSGELDITLFPSEYQRYGLRIREAQSWLVSGQVREHNGLSFIVSKMVLADTITTKCWYLRLTKEITAVNKRELLALMQKQHGETPVIIYDVQKENKVVMHEKYWLKDDAETQSLLIALLGKENVVLQE